MLVTQDQLTKLINEFNDAYDRHERMIDELKDKVAKLEAKKKPGRPPKNEE